MWPSPPWCIGSVFPASQLLTAPDSSSQPLFFEPSDAPHCVFKTGCPLSHIMSPVQVDSKYQVENIVASCMDDFFPEEPLIEALEEDSKMTQTHKYLTGNCLEGIQDTNGQIQLFFPVGSNNDKVGSCRYNSIFHGSVAPEQEVDGKTPLISSSISLCQPILQIAANKCVSQSEARNHSLAVRTLYQVHWLSSQLEEDHICFSRPGFQSFRHGTSHISWNPHVPGEASVLLENGEINIFDLKSLRFDDPCITVNMKEYIDHEVTAQIYEMVPDGNENRKKRKQKQKVSNADAHIPFPRKLTLEYAWHPKNLIVAGKKEIHLVDLRQKHGSQKFCYSVACSCCTSGLSSYCNQQRKNDSFSALTRADYDGMFQFAAASSSHLLLYDIRQPKTVLLQWEHRMRQEPPNYLQMHRISDLCSSNLQGGRVILAYSFKSGNVHAFCYGPHSSTELSFANIASVKNNEHREIVSVFNSWELPIKLNNTRFGEGNIERAFEAQHIKFEYYTPGLCEEESMFGVFNFSPCQGSQYFTMLQLTREGYIISQNYKVSGKLNSGIVCQHGSVAGRSSASTGYTGRKRYQLENMPAFLNYIQQGSLPPHIQITSSKSDLTGKHGHHTFNKLEDNFQNTMKTPDDQYNVDLKQIKNLSDLDIELCPIRLPFRKDDDMISKDTEQGMLIELKGQIRQWQMGFQPFVAYCKSCGSDNGREI